MATLPLAASVALHRRIGTWQRHVDAFIALTEFQRDLMVRAGLPEARVWVKPNFFPGNPPVIPWRERSNRVVFAGRLSDEKGVVDLVTAWHAWGEHAPELRILGDGPLRQSLEGLACQGRARVRFLGQVAPAVAEQEIAHARLLVLPSIWFEGFPMVIREAFAFGTPAAVSRIGPLPSIVEDDRTGVVFPPRDPGALLEAVRRAWTESKLERMSGAARAAFEANYAEEANHEQLIRIYERAIAAQRERSRS